MSSSVVIIGAGHGGVQAAASLREEGFDGRIMLIGDEAELPYHKPPLSKTFIKDAAAKPQILRAEAFYSGHAIDLALGESVESLDPAAKRLKLASGGSVAFDHAILATGSRPRMLPVEGGPLSGVLSLRSIADARAIRELAGKVEDVVILGGGFIGLEIAATLAAGGRRVTVVEAQERLLARAVAPEISAHVAKRLAGFGVKVLMRTTRRPHRRRERPCQRRHHFGRRAHSGQNADRRHRRRAKCRACRRGGHRDGERHPRRRQLRSPRPTSSPSATAPAIATG